MASVILRDLPEELFRALKQRASANGRSCGAEIRAILESVVMPPGRILLGSELAALGREFGGIELDIVRDQTPSEPISFD